MAEASVSPVNWPQDVDPIRVLSISDIHTGIFLKQQTLSEILLGLMELRPDLVAIGGDIVSSCSIEVVPYLDAFAPLYHPGQRILNRASVSGWLATDSNCL